LWWFWGLGFLSYLPAFSSWRLVSQTQIEDAGGSRGFGFGIIEEKCGEILFLTAILNADSSWMSFQ
jgi:hypothetical protein